MFMLKYILEEIETAKIKLISAENRLKDLDSNENAEKDIAIEALTIIEDFSKPSPYIDQRFFMVCRFCGADDQNTDSDVFEHLPDCTWWRARQLSKKVRGIE